MPPAAIPTQEETSQDTPLARIDSQQKESYETVRKFLETNGCRLVDSADLSQALMYHIVIGEGEYVKSILASRSYIPLQTFLITHSITKEDAGFFVKKYKAKVWVSREVVVEFHQIDVIFAFFFTSTEATGGEALPAPNSQEKHTSTSKEERIEKKDNQVKELLDEVKTPVAVETQPPDAEWEKRQRTIEALLRREQPSEATSAGHTKKGLLERFGRKSGGKIHEHAHFKKKWGGVRRSGLVVFSIAFFLFVWYWVSLALIGVFLAFGSQAVNQGNSVRAVRYSGLSQVLVSQNNSIIQMVSYPFQITGTDSMLRGQERLLSLLSNLSQSELAGGDLIEQGKNVATMLLSKEETRDNSPALAVDRMKQRVDQVQTSVNLADADLTVLLQDRPFPIGSSMVWTVLKKNQSRLKKYREALTSMHRALELYPAIAGFKQKKTYLVLLQNSAELRPTGGFIGSIALVSFDEGRLLDISVQDVYAVDGQLKGHIDPPVPIRELMSQEHWYLRDSNWDPDFSISGPKAAWFYEKETGTVVDGVIAINSPFIVDILRATGPVRLTDYHDAITADNFYAKSLFYTHTDFFPGSTQKKDFLGSLMTALVTQLTGSDKISMSTLLGSVSGALDQGDILFSFADSQMEQLARSIGWGGVPSFGQSCMGLESTCVNDGVSIVEANVGVNKVNYFITRTQDHAVTIGEDGSLTEESSSVYHNSSTSDDPAIGGGVYKDFARWYLPADAIVSSVLISGVAVPLRDEKNPAVGSLPYVQIDKSVPGWLIVGIAFAVPPTEDRRVSVAYKRQAKVPVAGDVARYNFRTIVQPGIRNGQYSVMISYPALWTVAIKQGSLTTSLVAKEGRVQYNTTVPKTQEVSLEFTK